MHRPPAVTQNGQRDSIDRCATRVGAEAQVLARLAAAAAFVLGLAGVGCYSERFTCLSEGCKGQGVTLRVWIDSADWRLKTVYVYDVPAADRAQFESGLTQGSGHMAPLIGEWETPRCQDFSEMSLIEADVPDEAVGREVGIVIHAFEKCSNPVAGCSWALAGFTFTTLTDGCQTIMMTPNLLP